MTPSPGNEQSCELIFFDTFSHDNDEVSFMIFNVLNVTKMIVVAANKS